MHKQLASEGLPIAIQILGINAPGLESHNATITAGADLPWLQDTPEAAAYGSWSPAFKDVIIVNEHNREVRVFNLGANDILHQAHYDELMAILRAEAGG